MDFKNESPASISVKLGERLKQARLNSDFTQAEVAERAGITRKLVGNAEKGKVQLEVLVAIMGVLGLSQQLEGLLPEQSLSPIQLSRLQGKKRERASGQRAADDKATPKW